ncbi:MAG: hypothetical protein OXF41_09235 [bacterium]|nr:hypothetical protein [Acidimicrobiia bacterium]MCY4369581.1 hypothetical protein [bacterium]
MSLLGHLGKVTIETVVGTVVVIGTVVVVEPVVEGVEAVAVVGSSSPATGTAANMTSPTATRKRDDDPRLRTTHPMSCQNVSPNSSWVLVVGVGD